MKKNTRRPHNPIAKTEHMPQEEIDRSKSMLRAFFRNRLPDGCFDGRPYEFRLDKLRDTAEVVEVPRFDRPAQFALDGLYPGFHAQLILAKSPCTYHGVNTAEARLSKTIPNSMDEETTNSKVYRFLPEPAALAHVMEEGISLQAWASYWGFLGSSIESGPDRGHSMGLIMDHFATHAGGDTVSCIAEKTVERLVQLKKSSIRPNRDTGIFFSEQRLHVAYFDRVGMDPILVQEVERLDNPTERVVGELRRLTSRLYQILGIIRAIREYTGCSTMLYREFVAVGVKDLGFLPTLFPPVKNDAFPYDELVATLEEEAFHLRRMISPMYLDLAKKFARKKERVLNLAKERAHLQKAVEEKVEIYEPFKASLVRVPSPIKGLPAHFSVLPSTLAPMGMEVHTSPSGKRVLKISRPGLRLQGNNNTLMIEPGAVEVQDIKGLFRPVFVGGNWILPLAITGITSLAERKGGFDWEGKPFSISCREFCQEIRPTHDFASKGLAGCFGRKIAPRELFWNTLRVLELLAWEGQDGRLITGYISILDELPSSATVILNPIIWNCCPGGDRPMYMITNKQVLFSYRSKELHKLPALQFYLELMARIIIRKSQRPHLMTQDGSGFKLETLLWNVGISPLRAIDKRRTPRELQSLAEGMFRRLVEKGILAGFEVDGRVRENVLETKYFFTMDSSYLAAYTLFQDQDRLRGVEKSQREVFLPKGRPSKKP